MSVGTETPLDAAIAAIDAQAESYTDESQLLVASKCRALMNGYDVRYRNAGYEAIAIEQTYTCDLVNPDTEAKSRTFKLAGKLDVIAREAGRLVLIDHKTTSSDIMDPNGAYWKQLALEGQASQYGILGWANGLKFDDIVWDAIRKPTISPKKITKAEIASAVSGNPYFGYRLSNNEVQGFVSGGDRETLAMYEARLTFDCITERPQFYFQRRPVPRLDSQLLAYVKQLWQIGQDVIVTRRDDSHFCNGGACMNYGTPCKFLGLCTDYDSPDSSNWQRKPFVHNELEGLEGDGRDLLTNSRVRCFQTCKRKHYYEYELGISRVDEEEKEALFFGSLLHLALEAWWKCFLVSKEI